MTALWEIVLIGIGLSMDALAASVALGAAEGKACGWKPILLTTLFFGGFQALMPIAGWFGGALCAAAIQSWGQYIAALLLGIIGGKMICEHNQKERPEFGLRRLTVLAFATSIDALLIGVGFSCLGMRAPDLFVAAAEIGLITAAISAAGCLTGRFFGDLLGRHCTVVGGLVLIGLGVKILLAG